MYGRDVRERSLAGCADRPDEGLANAALLHAAIFIAACFRAVFLAPVRPLVSAAFAALINAHLFLVATTIARLPAADSLRFFSGASDQTGSARYCTAARLFLCATPMRIRAAAFFVRRCRFCAMAVIAGPAPLPSSIARSSPICELICRFCSSNPRIAAVIISGVSLVIDMLLASMIVPFERFPSNCNPSMFWTHFRSHCLSHSMSEQSSSKQKIYGLICDESDG